MWESDAEPQDDATREYSSWDRNNDGAGYSRAGTSNNWGNPSTNDVMCQCNQPARK